MEVVFQSKEDSNRKQEEEFLKLLPMERFYRFLKLSEASKRLFPFNSKKEKENNFNIIIKD
ncbi:MAG: hypothetical protein COB15_12145 [Flavobacteriales bacterium]|nr:MAG: hypothetical protein COB15_12145 [Flavobacteriales bacterium]